jgi:dihydropteroate synthase
MNVVPPTEYSMRWKLASRELDCRVGRHGSGPLVMGILNVTPDSFSDGGKHSTIDLAVAQALRMQDDGADILDIGGESTRPYSEPVSADEELRRVVPVIERLRPLLQVPISVDTSKAMVAKAALEAGAEIINDVTGLEGDSKMLEVAVDSKAGVCVMHMQGTPQTMQDAPHYENVVEEIAEYLQQRWDWCVGQGLDAASLCLDPGIGFGKTHEHNLELIRNVSRFVRLGRPILIGHSRKGFIGKILGDKTADRDAGTLGISLAMAAAGAAVVRVHAVRATVDALRLYHACQPPRIDLP